MDMMDVDEPISSSNLDEQSPPQSGANHSVPDCPQPQTQPQPQQSAGDESAVSSGDTQVSLKLCLYGPKEGTVEKQFVPSTPLMHIEEEMRKLFMVNASLQTQLWVTTPSGTNTVYKAPAPPTTGASDDEQPVSASATDTTSAAPAASSTFAPSSSDAELENAELAPVTSAVPAPPPMPPMAPMCSTRNNTTAVDSSEPIPMPAQSFEMSRREMKSFGPPISPRTMSLLMRELAHTTGRPGTSKENTLLQTLEDAGITSNSVLTLEVANMDGTWPSSKPRLGAVTRSSKATPGLCGLSNMGNTCFMNAALQCLSNTPKLTNYILSEQFVNDINVDNPLGMRGEIARTYADLIKNMWSGSFTSFMPRDFKCAVGRFAPQFNGFQQQDCQELMAFLLDGLHEDLNRIKEKPYIEIKNEIDRRPDDAMAAESWSNYLKRNDSIVVDTFHSLLKSTLVCPECELVSVTFDPFCYLSLPLQVKREKQIDLVFVPAPRPLDSVMNGASHNVSQGVNGTGATSTESDNSTDDLIGTPVPSANEFRLQPVQISKFSIPTSGPISEVCESVARAINDSKVYGRSYSVDASNLIVAELYNSKVSRIYESAEHYTRFGDEFIIYERADKYCIPYYVRERKNEFSTTASVLGCVRVIHVPDTGHKTIYDAIHKQLYNQDHHTNTESLVPDSTSTDINGGSGGELMHADVPSLVDGQDSSNSNDASAASSADASSTTVVTKQQSSLSSTSSSSSPSGTEIGVAGEINGKSTGDNSKACVSSSSTSCQPTEAFKISVVNSNGTSTVSALQPGELAVYTSRLYLAADMLPATLMRPEYRHLKPMDSNNIINMFDTARALNIQRTGPKPTLKLQDCITQLTNVERLGADDPWYCPKCKKHQQATKKFDIWSLPNVLIIHLKRFSFSRAWRDKIDTLVDFPITGLDMSEHVLCPEQRAKSGGMVYDLIAVANHFGGLGGGHYTAHAKNAALGTWHYFDDTLVSPAGLDTVVSRNGYVLFYQRREQMNQ